MGLAVFHVGGGENRVERVLEPHARERELGVHGHGAGGDRARNAAPHERLHELARAAHRRNRLELEHAVEQALPLLDQLLDPPLGDRTEPRAQRLVGANAVGGEERRFAQGVAVAGRVRAPNAVVHLGGVEDDAVEVEQHGCEREGLHVAAELLLRRRPSPYPRAGLAATRAGNGGLPQRAQGPT